MQKGSVKWFNSQKGFGFITPQDGSGDVFVHFKNVKMDGFKNLKEGQQVEYETDKTPKGLQAINVTVTA